MSGEDLRDLPLPALFQRGRAILRQLEGSSAADPATQRLVADGAALLAAAAAAVDALALFSSNEDRDDLATGDIKYLLVPFYRGQVLGHTHAVDPKVRLEALQAAGQHYRAYLDRARQYGLLSPPAAALAEAALAHGGGDGGGGGGGLGMDAATLRQHKIEKFKHEKAIKARLEALEQQQRGGGGATAAEAAAEAERDGDAEEAEREAWLLQADLAALQAAEALGGLQQEAAILRHAAALPPDAREREARERAARGPPPDLVRQLAAAAGNLSSAGAQRQRLVEGVLRPGHQLPTMSVEQFGELEYKRMLEQQQREEAAKQRREAAEAARTEEEHEEEEVQKARAWDDFKDDNPRGWGNSKLRPCA